MLSQEQQIDKMPTLLTPGVLFLSRGALKFGFPCALALGILCYILNVYFGMSISIAYIALGAAAFTPLILGALRTYGQLYQQRRAAILGARLAPKLPGGIGNIDRVMQLVRSMENNICCTPIYSHNASN